MTKSKGDLLRLEAIEARARLQGELKRTDAAIAEAETAVDLARRKVAMFEAERNRLKGAIAAVDEKPALKLVTKAPMGRLVAVLRPFQGDGCEMHAGAVLDLDSMLNAEAMLRQGFFKFIHERAVVASGRACADCTLTFMDEGTATAHWHKTHSTTALGLAKVRAEREEADERIAAEGRDKYKDRAPEAWASAEKDKRPREPGPGIPIDMEDLKRREAERRPKNSGPQAA